MHNDRDWLYRPARLGMCLIESLKDGTLDLDDIADANEALDAAEENQSRHNVARSRKD